VCHRCATPRPVLLPISKISHRSNGEAICAIRGTGRRPLIGIVQHFPDWCILFGGLGPPPSVPSSGFHPKGQAPFRVEDKRRCCFSASEKPLDGLHTRRSPRRQGCHAGSQTADAYDSGAGVRLKPWKAAARKGADRASLARDQRDGRQGSEQCRGTAMARPYRGPVTATYGVLIPNSRPPIGPGIISPTAMSWLLSICPLRTASRRQSAGNCWAGLDPLTPVASGQAASLREAKDSCETALVQALVALGCSPKVSPKCRIRVAGGIGGRRPGVVMVRHIVAGCLHGASQGQSAEAGVLVLVSAIGEVTPRKTAQSEDAAGDSETSRLCLTAVVASRCGFPLTGRSRRDSIRGLAATGQISSPHRCW